MVNDHNWCPVNNERVGTALKGSFGDKWRRSIRRRIKCLFRHFDGKFARAILRQQCTFLGLLSFGHLSDRFSEEMMGFVTAEVKQRVSEARF